MLCYSGERVGADFDCEVLLLTVSLDELESVELLSRVRLLSQLLASWLLSAYLLLSFHCMVASIVMSFRCDRVCCCFQRCPHQVGRISVCCCPFSISCESNLATSLSQTLNPLTSRGLVTESLLRSYQPVSQELKQALTPRNPKQPYRQSVLQSVLL